MFITLTNQHSIKYTMTLVSGTRLSWVTYIYQFMFLSISKTSLICSLLWEINFQSNIMRQVSVLSLPSRVTSTYQFPYIQQLMMRSRGPYRLCYIDCCQGCDGQRHWHSSCRAAGHSCSASFDKALPQIASQSAEPWQWTSSSRVAGCTSRGTKIIRAKRLLSWYASGFLSTLSMRRDKLIREI